MQKGWSEKTFPKLDSENTLIIIFGDAKFIDIPAPLSELQAAYPTSKVIGCSTAGEIFGSVISENSISVAVMRFEHTKIAVTCAKVAVAADSLRAGEEIAKKLNKPDLCGVFILSDGMHVNGTSLVKNINAGLSPNVIVTGGLAGDGDRFKRTWTLCNGLPLEKLVAAVGFYGDRLHIGHGSRGGWDSFGLERRITRSEGNVLYELDGKPALALYKEYLGERASGLPATGLLFPLAIRRDHSDTRQLVRTILAVNEQDQSMSFASDIPQGYLAQLMRANFDRLVDGANEAALAAGDKLPTNLPILSIAISCVGRRLLLGERTEEETETVLESFPKQTQQIGFYSYGELSPYASGACDLHNQTMTLTTLYE